jgi:ABC-type enterochelin transport system substrate-binding protein
MMMRTTVAISLVVLLAFAGCGAKDKQAASTTGAATPQTQVATNAAATSLTPEELGELGAKIRKTPERANEILRDRGLTEKTFETEIRKVTEDPEASKRYAAAYKRAS